MEQQNYTPNSDKYKAQQEEAEGKHLEKVTSGEVKVKKSGWQKFKEVFLPDGPDNMANYIIMAVIIPEVKKIILDTVDSLLYGEARTHSDRKSAYISYDKMSNTSRGTRVNESNVSATRKKTKDFQDIVYVSKRDAEDVLDKMDDILSEYGTVSIADMEDLAGVTTTDYTNVNYGWTDLRGAKVVPTRDGYVIELPKAAALTH